MIWVFISAAVILSYLLCRKDCKRPEYLILILFPIEMYGITITSFILKPYMVAGLFAFLYSFKKGGNISKNIVILIILLVMSNLLTELQTVSIMQHAMFVMNLVIASSIITCQREETDLEAIGNVAVATLVGHGIVFAVCSVIIAINPSFQDIIANDRLDNGVFLSLAQGETIVCRMRGFSIDPNSFPIPYVLGGAYAFYNFLTGNRRIYNALATSLFLFIVFQSGSRSDILSLGVLTVLIISLIIKSDGKNAQPQGIIVTYSVFLIFGIILNANSILLWLSDFFTQRAGLEDESGRFWIWKENMNYLFDSNGIWFGVGQGLLTDKNRIGLCFHNTFLEWIGGTGIIIGSIISLFFLRILFSSFYKYKDYCRNSPNAALVLLSYLAIVLMLFSVSNITNISLIFLALLLNDINHREQKKEKNMVLDNLFQNKKNGVIEQSKTPAI